MEPAEIKRRLGILESDRDIIEDTWDIIEEFVVPYRGEFFREQSSESEIDWKNRNLYDSTAVVANNILASSIHGSLTNPSYRWFELRFRKDELNSNNESKQWLDEVASRIYYMLQESNFNLEIGETYIDICAFGTSVLTLEQENSGDETELIFKSIPLKEAFFETNHKGQLENFYRRLLMTPVQMIAKFGRDKVPAEIVDRYDQGEVEVRYHVVMCIYRRPENPIREGRMAEDKRPYGMKYVLLNSLQGDSKTELEASQLGDTKGYYEMPSYVARWRVTSESKFGNSPAMVALPDILTLQQLVQLILKSAEKVVDPPTMVTERGLLSDVDMEPGGLTVVRSLDSMQPYESRARFDVSELQRDRLIDAINRIFYVDQLQLKDSPTMTATEVQVRYELMQRLLGPTIGRIQVDVLKPLIERAFNILYREGLLPERPAILEDEADIDIQYTGPLARAQKTDTAIALERWLQLVATIGEIYPEAMDVPDIVEIAKMQAEALNIPAKAMNSDTDIKKRKREREEQQAAASQAAIAQQAGDAMKSVGEGQQAISGEGNG